MSQLRKHEVTTNLEPLKLLEEAFEMWLALDVWSYGSHAQVLMNGNDGTCCNAFPIRKQAAVEVGHGDSFC